MSRILRLAVIGLMLTLTSLVLDVVPVGARWVHMGDGSIHFYFEKVCKDGIKIWYANTQNADPNFKITINTKLTWSGSFKLYSGILDDPGYYDGPQYIYPEDALKNAPTITKRFSITAVVRSMDDIFAVGNPDFSTPLYGEAEIPWTKPPKNQPYKYIVYDVDFGNGYIAGYVKLPDGIEDCLLFSHPSDPDAPNFTDSRVDAYEPWQSVSAYCEDKMVKVYGIDANANGYFAFAITQEDIDKLGIPKENTLLDSAPSAFGGDIRLYKLKDTGELQINAPGLPPESWKEYVFTWTGCS
ncbi:MAG: hypothetical protein GC179_05370 [Anaerolineaceae bacterium]|nr:hypothetical protein [Anaerolineaceae bacterium]